MQAESRMAYLKIAITAIGMVFITGVPAMMIWILPLDWSWMPSRKKAS